MVRIDNLYGRATLEDVADFERRNNLVLPASYKSFIVKNNGGSPSPSLFVDRIRGFTANIALFFPINSGAIEREIADFPFCVEEGLLPIALDGGGDYFFLELRTGAVYYWNHELHPQHRFSIENLDWVAENMSRLVSQLEGDEREEPGEIERIGESGDEKALGVFLMRHGIDDVNESSRTVAMEAARYGNLTLLKGCVKRGAGTRYLIHYAARNDRIDVIEYLLSLGVEINERDERGRTALSYAIVYDHVRRFLTENGAVE